MKRWKKTVLAAATAGLLCGCSAPVKDSEQASEASSLSETADLTSESSVLSENALGTRTLTALEDAVRAKNDGEQFVLLYTKEDCEYCAQFDEILNPYLEEHPLNIHEVSLTDSEWLYTDEDREAMLNILSAGVSRTPALYYIESPEQVYLLDHTEDNYSLDGLEQWVEKYDLTSLS